MYLYVDFPTFCFVFKFLRKIHLSKPSCRQKTSVKRQNTVRVCQDGVTNSVYVRVVYLNTMRLRKIFTTLVYQPLTHTRVEHYREKRNTLLSRMFYNTFYDCILHNKLCYISNVASSRYLFPIFHCKSKCIAIYYITAIR